MARAERAEQLARRAIDPLTEHQDLLLFELALDPVVSGAQGRVRREQHERAPLARAHQLDDRGLQRGEVALL